MPTKMKNPKMVCFVLLLSGFMSSADTMTLQPIIDLLATKVFPQYGYSTVSMIMNASALALAIISVVTGALTKFGKKRLLLIGSALFTVGGLAGATITNLYFIIFTRLFEGLGAGMVLTVSMMLIPSLFQDQQQVDKIMGYNGILMALFSAIITFTSGYMALVNWKLPFLYYALGAIVFVLQWIYIPNDKSAAEENMPAQASHISKAGMVHALNGFTFGLFTTFFFVCISGVLAQNGIGDASVAGTASTFNTIGSFFSGFVFAAVFNKLKRFSPTVFYVILAAAVLGLLNVSTIPLVCAVAFLHGIGWNMFFSYYLAKVSMFSDEGSLDANMSLCNGAFYLGQFVTPLAMTAVAAVTGNDSPVFAQKFALICLAALAIIHFICAIIGNAQEKAAA